MRFHAAYRVQRLFSQLAFVCNARIEKLAVGVGHVTVFDRALLEASFCRPQSRRTVGADAELTQWPMPR